MPFIYNDNKLKNRRKGLRNNMPKPEQVMWYWLKSKKLKGYKFRRQYSVDYYILDFYCPEIRLGIEIDGDSHFNKETLAYDDMRNNFLAGHDIKIVRFTNKDVVENIEAVIEKVLKYLP